MQLTNLIAVGLPLLALASAKPVMPDAGHESGTGPMGNHEPGFHRPDARTIEARGADTDKIIREKHALDYGYFDTVVIKKGGPQVGECHDRASPDENTYLQLSNVGDRFMCTYYEKAGCKGMKAGPWSAKETVWSQYAYQRHMFDLYNPQSYQCRLITFDHTPAPAPKCYAIEGCGTDPKFATFTP